MLHTHCINYPTLYCLLYSHAIVSVEDILSYEVRSKFHVSKGRGVTSSGRVLQELGKSFPEAASLFNRCFEGSPSSGAEGSSSSSREDYAQLQSGSPAERKVLWIRVALVDAKLQTIVEQLMKKRRYSGLLYNILELLR